MIERGEIMKRLNMDEFKNYVVKFLDGDSDKKTLLVRGYFDKDKLLHVLESIRDSEKINEALFVLGEAGICDVPRLFNDVFLDKRFKSNTRLNTRYDFPGAIGTFTKWRQHIDYTFGNRYDLAVFYPVETVLFDPKDSEKFIKTVKNSLTNKNILITTNDFSQRPEQLYDVVDEVLILDTKNKNEENKEQFETIKSNLERDNKSLPY